MFNSLNNDLFDLVMHNVVVGIFIQQHLVILK